MAAGGIEDMAGNDVEEVSETSAAQVRVFGADETNPEIVSFNLDLSGDGELQLTFSETIDASTVDVTELTLQSGVDSTDGGSQVSLSGGSVSEEDSTIVVISLIVEDVNAIKAAEDLATSRNNTFQDGHVRPIFVSFFRRHKDT